MTSSGQQPSAGRTDGAGPRYRRRRLLASLGDLPVVLAWAAVAAVVGVALQALDAAPRTPAGWDAIAFLTLIAPVTLTLALAEASSRQGTPGKRRLRLVVVDRAGRRLGRGRSLARSGVKFAPWQAAHTAVFQLASGREDAWLLALSVGAQLVVVASTLMMLVDRHHRALHDLVAGTRVTERPAPLRGTDAAAPGG